MTTNTITTSTTNTYNSNNRVEWPVADMLQKYRSIKVGFIHQMLFPQQAPGFLQAPFWKWLKYDPCVFTLIILLVATKLKQNTTTNARNIYQYYTVFIIFFIQYLNTMISVFYNTNKTLLHLQLLLKVCNTSIIENLTTSAAIRTTTNYYYEQ